MINVQEHPLSDLEAKEIRDWLNLPSRRKFQAYLHNIAARLAADAANVLALRDQTKELKDSAELAQAFELTDAAHKFRGAADILLEYSNPEARFLAASLTPEPITPTQEQKQ